MEEKKVDIMIEKKNSDKEEAIRRLVPYIRELIGDRSIRQASVDMGIAASYLSGMLKGNYMPSAEILRKMADEKASPQRGVTLEDLMVAAGYQNDYVLTVASKVMETDETKEEQIGSSSRCSDEVLARQERMRKVHERYRMSMKYAKTANAIILSELVQNNISFTQVNEPTGEVKGYKPDLILHVPKQPVLEWWFEFRFFPAEQMLRRIDLHHMFAQLLFMPPKIERKMSYVVDNVNVFELLLEYVGQLSYRGDLSVILVDTEEMCIRREAYLAHYQERDTGSEFYIV